MPVTWHPKTWCKQYMSQDVKNEIDPSFTGKVEKC